MNLLDWLWWCWSWRTPSPATGRGSSPAPSPPPGLLLGGLFGVWLAPVALGDANPSLLVSLGALFIVILAASLGQGLLQWGGAKIRDRITWQPVRALDAIGGAALSACAVLIVAWALGVAVSGSRIDGVTPWCGARCPLQVNEVLPQRPGGLLDAFNDVVGTSFFPRYLEPFSPERIVDVQPGDRRMLRDPDVTRAGSSVLKVRGTNECGRGIEGSGFLYAQDRLMTNAHVVAGVDDPQVVVGDDTTDARSSSTTPSSTSPYSTSTAVRSRCSRSPRPTSRPTEGPDRDPRLSAGRALRHRAGRIRADAEAALAGHLR